MAQSEFDKWFTAQFGPPTFKTREAEQDARAELNSRRLQLVALEAEMRRHDNYEQSKTAAMYAWTAKPSNEIYGEKTRQVRLSSPTIIPRAYLPTPNNRTYPQRVIGFLDRSCTIHRKRQARVSKLVALKLHRCHK